jgi:hypothetical protein
MATAPLDAGLNPAQQEVLTVLGAPLDDRPTFDPTLRHELRAQLEAGVAGAVAHATAAGLVPLTVTKHALSGVHGCEARYVAGREFPGWSVATARGSVAHKAIELSMNVREEPVPLDLVDDALARLSESETGLATWLQGCSELDRAELRSVANQRVAAFLEQWPPLQRRWRPVAESPARFELCDGAIVLRAKVDLTLGIAEGTRAGKVLVDLKTGGFSPAHRDDLRFYALVETMKMGVPPRLLASYYLEAARTVPEVVTEAVLQSAVSRLVDGVERLVTLAAGDDEPIRRAGPACRWCPIRRGCPVGGDEREKDDDER